MSGYNSIPPALDKIFKIGILRTNALGDFIVTLPAIQSLKNYFPKAEFTLFGNYWHKDFLEEKDASGKRRTPIDKVIVTPIINGLREEKGKSEDPKAIQQFYHFIQHEKYDLMISFQGKGDSSSPFLLNSKAKHTLGLYSNGLITEPPDTVLDYYYYQSEVIRFLELVSQIGVPTGTLEPSIQLLDKDYEEAKAFLTTHDITERYVAIHAGSNDSRRMWPTEKWVQVCHQLKNHGLSVILTGTEKEHGYNASILQQSNSDGINAAGSLSLGGVAALYHLSRAVIAVDTGTLHLAIASKAKTVGLYWAPNVINWSPLYRKNHRPVISWELKCPVCGIIPNTPYPFEPVSKTCSHERSFLENITSEEVLKAVFQLL